MSTPPSGPGPADQGGGTGGGAPGPYGPPPQGQPGGYGPPPQGGYGPPPHGQPGGYGPPPQQGGFPPPQPGQPGQPGPDGSSPKPKGSVLKRVGAIVAVIVVVIGVRIAFTELRQNDAVDPGVAVGDCVTVTNASATDTETETVDCSDPTGVYEVASTGDGTTDCPTEDYTTFTLTAGNETSVVCLAANFTEGQCYDGLTGVYSTFTQVDCGSFDAQAKVALRAEGQADESLCEPYADTLLLSVVYPQPSRTYCLVDPST